VAVNWYVRLQVLENGMCVGIDCVNGMCLGMDCEHIVNIVTIAFGGLYHVEHLLGWCCVNVSVFGHLDSPGQGG
jgi:hypothetical protein